jgi:hypothetical protein
MLTLAQATPLPSLTVENMRDWRERRQSELSLQPQLSLVTLYLRFT